MRARLLAAVVAVAIAGVALGDRETAQFAAGRADKALAAKKFDEAEGLYRKALEEDAAYLPAHYGLAQALIGAGKTAAALDELRKFTDDANQEAATLPSEWKPLVAKATKQLTELDAAGAAFAKIQGTYADTLVDFAQRWMAKDPASAERALRRSLKLKPGNPKAIQLLEKAGMSTAKEVVQLFDRESFEGWTAMSKPEWTINEGEIVGVIRDGAVAIWTLRSFDGDFTVRCEARLLEEYAQPSYFGFMPCMKAKEDSYTLGVLRGKLDWGDNVPQQPSRSVASRLPTDLKKPFNSHEWNTYELRCTGRTVTALVNGEEIGHEERPERRTGGAVGLKMQGVEFHVRKIEVEVR